ncbi:MAG: carotenoid biosynthesis protein [Gemmatimonadota bacterium]
MLPRSLWPLAVFTALSLAGYGTFALAPQRIPSSMPAVMRFYQMSFEVSAQAHIVVALLTALFALRRAAGWRWLRALLATSGLAFLSEWVGTGYGLPFGPYRYTGLLGPRIGGRVPWSIPISWFLMALPSFLLARHAFRRRGRALRLVAGAALLTIWDLALDPAMSHLIPYWVWGEPGPYYGMPLVNLVGWMLTGLVLMMVLERLGAADWGTALPPQWLRGYYTLILAMPVGMLALAGVWGAVAATGLALVLWAVSALPERAAQAVLPSESAA